jgi:hypothetical protein
VVPEKPRDKADCELVDALHDNCAISHIDLYVSNDFIKGHVSGGSRVVDLQDLRVEARLTKLRLILEEDVLVAR